MYKGKLVAGNGRSYHACRYVILIREYNDLFSQSFVARAMSNWVSECDA